MSSALIFGNAPKQSVGEMLPMSSRWDAGGKRCLSTLMGPTRLR